MDMINEIGRWLQEKEVLPTALERLGMGRQAGRDCAYFAWNYGITGNSELFLWIEAGKILVISDSFCDWNRSSCGCGDADYVR